MSYKTIYDAVTGDLKLCKKLSDLQTARILTDNPGWAVLNRAVDGIGINRINPVTLAIERIPVTPPSVANLIRERRIELLAASDWTQVLDSPLTESQKTAWATYRQALRDLPDDQGAVNSFEDVVWPTPPQ
jgi:hypothetical protein